MAFIFTRINNSWPWKPAAAKKVWSFPTKIVEISSPTENAAREGDVLTFLIKERGCLNTGVVWKRGNFIYLFSCFVLAEFLNNQGIKLYSQPAPLSEILIVAYLLKTASRIWACTEPWDHDLLRHSSCLLKRFYFLRKVLFVARFLYFALLYTPNFLWFQMTKPYLKQDFNDLRFFVCNKDNILLYRVGVHEGLMEAA